MDRQRKLRVSSSGVNKYEKNMNEYEIVTDVDLVITDKDRGGYWWTGSCS